MPKHSVEISGMAELEKTLKELPRDLLIELGKRSMKEGLDVLADAYRQNFNSLPSKSGGKTGTIAAIVGAVDTKITMRKYGLFGRVGIFYDRTGLAGTKAMGSDTPAHSPLRARLAHIIEFGRKTRLPYRGLLPATRAFIDNQHRVMSIIEQSIIDELQKDRT